MTTRASLNFAFGPDLGNLDFDLIKDGDSATVSIWSGDKPLVAFAPLSSLKDLISFLRIAEELFPEELGRIHLDPTPCSYPEEGV